MRTLGGFYTRTLRVTDGQPVVETGPYAVVRHPGYLGSLLVWTGFGLASRSLPAVIGAAAPMAIAYRHRMAAEEAMLEARLGEPYRRYEGRTWRLLPYVY
jgi:protein-S-isoprenylcysteine O-methyltransferase